MNRNATIALSAICLGLCNHVGWAQPPQLYQQPAYESPVRGDPDDLLLLPGYGFASDDLVVYQAIVDTTQPLTPPASVPRTSTEALGVADLASVVDAPYSLTIHLPAVVKPGQSYALWVVNPNGEWSNGIRINDARPLWITPDEVYSSSPLVSLPRTLKIMGRNLQPVPGAATQVRLVGAKATYTLPATIDATLGSAIDRYVAQVQLPTGMPIGAYSVLVSRDGVSWVPPVDRSQAARQTLRVLADPMKPATFRVGDYTFGSCSPSGGNCRAVRDPCVPDPNEHNDQTLCIAAAIAAAHAAGGGAVLFGSGSWTMSDAGTWPLGRHFSSTGVSYDGVLVPDGVSLQGAGTAATTLVRGAGWNVGVPTFALQGHNTVSGFTFRDEHVYRNKDSGTGFLTLGVRWDRVNLYGQIAAINISHVVISHNIFDKPFYAVGNGGLAIDHLVVSDNVFGAFKIALMWEGNPANTTYRYHYSDSVVSYNKFFPGSYLDTSIGQGTMASALSGGYRIDFSNNVADGTSTAYFYNPQADAKGWRAAFFWAMHDNVEMLLLSKNLATCTGDKDGDGEAISYDNNHNRPGFASIDVPVLAAASNRSADTSTITVRGSLIERQISYGRLINVSPVSSYYLGDWLQVVQGPGIGQARKISAINVGSNGGVGTITFAVTPAFDVLPQTNSLVTDGRLYWQTYTVGNVIDQRTPTCLKSNRTRQAGGLITLYGSTADSVVEGNRQYDTSGMLVAHLFKPLESAVGAHVPEAFVQSFNEIRDNLVSGAYNDSDRTPQAEYGIVLGYAATPDTAPPPTLSYGLAVSHNTVIRAGAPKGFISLAPIWHTGPISTVFRGVTPWKIADATLLFKNTLTDIGQPGARVGIGVSAGSAATPVEWRTVAYGNLCNGASALATGLLDLGTQTVRVCPSARADSCECDRQPTDLGISGVSELRAAAGSAVTYTLRVTNNGPSTATDAMLSAEASAGFTIDSMKGTGITCGVAGTSLNLCHLGDISAGATVSIEVGATINATGASKASFSVTHREPDTNPRNDSVDVVATGIVASTHAAAPQP